MIIRMSLPVFQNGTWITYPLPKPVDALWSQSNIFQAASFYAAALSQGYEPNESAILAEAYIHKKVYNGLQYHDSLENKLKSIMSRVEKA